MTDRPYTDDDLIAEAARQHHAATEDPDFMGVGELLDGELIPSTAVDLEPETGEPLEMGRSWSQLGDHYFDEAQRRIHDLVNGAANTSAWAVKLGAAGLEPHEPMAVRSTTGGWEVAVQVATNPSLTDDARTELLDAIRAAVEEATCRVLGMKPAT